MTRRKQPSKRAREMAARYCDARSAWWNDLCGYPNEFIRVGGQVGALADAVLNAILNAALASPARYEGRSLAEHWAEAAAWLRSGEDLP